MKNKSSHNPSLSKAEDRLVKYIGYDKPLYVLPFDHRGSFETKMFGWHGDLTESALTSHRPI